MRKAFVLLSGGLDSTTCLHKAIVDYAEVGKDAFDPGEVQTRLRSWPYDIFKVDWVEAISINYGQRHIKEASYAEKTCDKFGIKHTVIDVQGLLGKSMLTDKNAPIPNIPYGEIQGVSPTYVPFRNGTMLSVIAAHAQLWVNSVAEQAISEAGIYFGAHSEDAHNWAYPDCTPEFIGAMANAIYVGTYHAVRLHTPLQWLNKAETVQLGQSLGVDFKNTWSCYAGEELQCGTCPTCRARKDAFKQAGVDDPTEYAA